MWAGIAAARVGERRILELARQVRSRHLPHRPRPLHGLRRAGVAPRSRRAAEGPLFPRRGAGQRHGLHRDGRDQRRRVRRRPARQPRPGRRAEQRQPRRLDGRGADGVHEHHRQAQGCERRALPAADAPHTPGIGVRRESACRVRDLLRGRGPAVRPDLALPRAAPRRPPAGRQLRLDLRHLHRRPAPRHRDATSRSSSRRSAAGARPAAATATAPIFSGFHGDTFNCPAEVAEARYGLYVDRLALNDADGGEGEHRGGKGIVLEYRVRSNGCFFTCAYTRNRHPPWAARRRSRRARPTTWR